MSLRLLIVDHVAEARTQMAGLCNNGHSIHVIGEASSGVTAIEAASRLHPQLVLVNTELPDMTGVDVLKAIGSPETALGIMVAARDDFAAAAFAEGAVDYLIKPVSRERFEKAISRAQRQLDSGAVAKGAAAGREQKVSTAPAPPMFLIGERQRRLYPLDPLLIDYIEVDRNYVTLRIGKVEYISRDSIRRLSGVLEEFGFVRIERSVLMNLRAVSYVELAGHGTFAFTLKSGICLHSSAPYRAAILTVLPLPALAKRYPTEAV